MASSVGFASILDEETSGLRIDKGNELLENSAISAG